MTSRHEGPFVMNTEEELDQAVIDHPSGRRTEIESPARPLALAPTNEAWTGGSIASVIRGPFMRV